MRLVLEPLATRLAATRCDGRSIRRLERVCEKMIDEADRGDLGNLDQTDYEFHLTIVKSCGHRRLLRAYENSHILVVGPRVQMNQILANTAPQHRLLIDCIRQRDAEKAETLARDHVSRGLHAVEQTLGTTLDGSSLTDVKKEDVV